MRCTARDSRLCFRSYDQVQKQPEVCNFVKKEILRPATVLKKETLTQGFSCEFANFLKIPPMAASDFYW